MSRNILLIEPDYKNKYPPLGLMKLATYHRMLGDTVRFFKGNLVDLVIENIANMMIGSFNGIDSSISWGDIKSHFIQHIRNGNSSYLDDQIKKSERAILLYPFLMHYRKYYKTGEYKKNPQYDRICIATLFTFHWDISVKTIEKAKNLVKNTDQIFVGGVLATVLSTELKDKTKVRVLPGLLNYKGALDDNNIIIDTLPLDYSILFETDYIYPANNAFFAYATRSCPNSCGFCAVPILEPKPFKHYISIKNSIEKIKRDYGDMPNLLLMDNNVLASDKFHKIIDDIKQCGFEKGATFTEPNYLDIYIKQLRASYNDYGFSRAIFRLYAFILERAQDEDKQNIYNILYENNLIDICSITKKSLLKVYPLLKQYYEKYRNISERQRIVDFNQGLEASKITDEKAKLLSEICINPLRIAFDSIKDKDVYIRSILRCHKYGINSFSNYLLYNYYDEPVDLYKRLKINVMLCEKQKISIYSFPMKYHPINGEYSKNRDFRGEHWNRKYIRAIQVILNATKGKIGRGKSFFYKAFGKTILEFKKLLLMPEAYLLYRFFFEDIGLTKKWTNHYSTLSVSERHEFFDLIKDNKFKNEIYESIENIRIKKLYKHYLVTRDDLEDITTELGKQKFEYDQKIKRSQRPPAWPMA